MQVICVCNINVVETHFIEHLVEYQSEYDELREIAEEFPDRAEVLFDRLVVRTSIPDWMESHAYAYVFEGYDPLT
jgi:hypothetical protein